MQSWTTTARSRKGTKRTLTAADQIRAGKESVPRHYEGADIEVAYSIQRRE